MLKANLRLGKGLIPITSDSRKGFDYRYTAKHKENIPSDNSFNKIHIQDWKFPVSMHYEASPVSDKNVYVKCESRGNAEDPLLKGPLDLFVFNDYLGTTIIETASNLGNLSFNLGKDNDVQVERKEDIKMDTSGFFYKSEVKKYTIDYKIKNNKRSSVEVELIDRIPYTNNKSISIKVLTKVKNMTIDDQGIIRYKKKVAANSRSNFTIQYELSYPIGHILNLTPREAEK
jgi:uncharacterized protein (TIGR02231 family)